MPLNATLASSLLEIEADQHRNAIRAGGRIFKTGIEALDRDLPGSLWRGGDIVGIGSDISSGSGNKAESPPLEIIVTHLLDGQVTEPHEPTSDANSDNTRPSVFIVAPPTQATTSIQQIYTKLNTRFLRDQQRPKQRTTPAATNTTATTTIDAHLKSLLTRLSLLQYLDISGLTESISEILTILTSTQSQPPQRTIVLLQSLPQTLTTTHRRTGTLQAAALLTTLLQLLRNVVRISGGSCLILIELDVSWTDGNTNTNTTVPLPMTVAAGLLSLRTAFSSRSGKLLCLTNGPVFGRILEEGVDVLVVLHDGEGRVGRGQGQTKRIVECVRDERGGKGYGDSDDDDDDGVEDAFGAWTLWE